MIASRQALVGWTGPALAPFQGSSHYYGLEQALIDSFKREAEAAAAVYARTAGVSAVAFLRSRGGRSAVVPYTGDDTPDNSPLRQWWSNIAGENPEAEKNFPRWEFAAIMVFDRRYQPPRPTFRAYALSPAIVGPLRDLETRVGAWPKEHSMSIYGDYTGAEPQVGNLLPFLLGLPLGALGGYFYRGWRDEHPGQWIPGVDGNPPHVGGPWLDMIGNAPYEAPYVGGPWLDMASPPPYVGGPWLDMASPPPYVGGPWLDMASPPPYVVGNAPYDGGPWHDFETPYVGAPGIGAEMDPHARRRAWLQTRALIESAKREAIDAQAMTPAAAWVWSLDPPSVLPSTSRVSLTSAQLTPFASVEQAQAYMFEQAQMPHVALALFDTSALRHWPNPVRWTKSDDPSYEPLIAQRIAQYAPARMAGDYVGASPRPSTIGTALDDVRSRAQALASKRVGSVVGVIHTTKDNLWRAVAFNHEVDADDWLETVTLDQAAFTYAAYYDKADATWPQPVIEKIGGFRAAKKPRALIGSTLDDARTHAKALATAKPGNAAGVVHLVDGSWSTFTFPNLDTAIDWLSGLTANRANFVYAGAFEKGSDGTAYIQQEEFGTRPASPNQRSLSATSGEHTWGAV